MNSTIGENGAADFAESIQTFLSSNYSYTAVTAVLVYDTSYVSKRLVGDIELLT